MKKNTFSQIKKSLFTFLALVISQSISAQTPIINSFTPNFGPIGTQVVISGSNFNATPTNNTVFFGATKAVVSAATANSLTVTVPIGATFNKITVTTNSLVAYSRDRFVVDFTFCNSPNVNANSWGSNPATYTTSGSDGGVAVADFDKDGKVDIVVANATSVSVLRNTSTSTLINASSFAGKIDFTVGNQINSIKTGDIDGDGKIDILVTNAGGTSPSISILRNISTIGVINASSFAAPVNITLTHSGFLMASDIDDIDGDGKADIALAISSNYVCVLRNIGSAGSITTSSFAPDVTFAITNPSYGIAIEDIDGNGKRDIVVSTNRNFQVLEGTSTSGTISFGSIATFLVDSPRAKPFAIADFDFDGRLDLVSRSSFTGLSVFRNTSTPGVINGSTFAPVVKIANSNYSEEIAISDVDGDGRPDIVVPSAVFVNNITAPGPFNTSSFGPQLTTNNPSTMAKLAIGDLNNDGLPELICATPSSGVVNVMRRYAGQPASTASICMVTVDSLSINNEIYWDRSLYPELDSMIIYREVTSNVFKRVGAVSKNALSMFTDTARSIGPANGDPNIGTYRYKIQVRDSCGNFGDQSLWHNTVFFINSGGTFFWNQYFIELNTNPMTQFDLGRDNFAPTGIYTTVGSVAGTQTTLNDPFYVAYQNTADWRVFAYGLTCNPTLRLSPNSNVEATIVKSRSNVKNNRGIGVKENQNNNSIKLYPNPANTEVSIQLNKDCANCVIEITNAIGQVLSIEKLSSLENKINIAAFANGIYYIKLKSDNKANYVQKLIVQH